MQSRHFLFLASVFFAAPLSNSADAQFDFGRIIKRARTVVQPTRNRMTNRGRKPAIVRQLERAAINEIERAAPQVGRIIRQATGNDHRVLPYPDNPPVRIVFPPARPVITRPVRRNPGNTEQGGTDSGQGSAGQEQREEIDLESLPEVSAGQQVALEGEDLGTQPGKVIVEFTGLKLKAKIVKWDRKQTQVAMPELGIEEPALAYVHLVLADGKLVQSLPVKFSPAAKEAAAVASEPSLEDLPGVTAGEQVVLDGQDLGTKAGLVKLTVGALSVKAKVLEWTDAAVTVQMPAVDLEEPAKAKVQVIRADGEVATSIDVRFDPATAKTAAAAKNANK